MEKLGKRAKHLVSGEETGLERLRSPLQTARTASSRASPPGEHGRAPEYLFPRQECSGSVANVSVTDPKNLTSLAPIRTKIGTERELVLIMKNLQYFAVLFIFLEVRCISVEQHSKI